MDRDDGTLRRPLNKDPRDASFLQSVLDIITDLEVFLKFSRKIFFVVPIRIPCSQNSETKSNRMYFLSQSISYVFDVFFAPSFTFCAGVCFGFCSFCATSIVRCCEC